MTVNTSQSVVLIIGPTRQATFFIADAQDRVWDGAQWRGFGAAEHYPTYRDAFKAHRLARAAQVVEA